VTVRVIRRAIIKRSSHQRHKGVRCREETLGSQVEGDGNLGVVPLLEVECGLFEDVDRPNIVVFECVSEKGDVVWGDLVSVLVVLVGLAGRRARRGTSSVGPVARRFSAIPMMLPDLSWRAHAV